MSFLESAILNTLIYFDIFDYPLTLFEVWKWLFFLEKVPAEETKISDVQKVLLESEKLNTIIETKEGFYFLKGKEKNISLRLSRYNIAERKIKKAVRYVKNYFRYIPFIKFIGLCNTLGFSHSREDSDIDFFIIAEKGKIWSARESVVLLSQFLNLRPASSVTRDRFCFTFFVDEKNLNIESIALKSQDIYLLFWINQVIPIYDESNLYDKFLVANNFTKKFLPYVFTYETAKVRKAETIPTGFKMRFLHWENFSRYWQKRVMAEKLKELTNKDKRVIVSDTMLKFHLNDRREQFNERFWRNRKEIMERRDNL